MSSFAVKRFRIRSTTSSGNKSSSEPRVRARVGIRVRSFIVRRFTENLQIQRKDVIGIQWNGQNLRFRAEYCSIFQRKGTEGWKRWLLNRATLPLVIKASALSLYAWLAALWLVAWDSGASPEILSRVATKKKRINSYFRPASVCFLTDWKISDRQVWNDGGEEYD